MAYLGNAPARSFISFERQVFTIVNSQTAYTLDHSVNNENDIRLVINNIVQEPGSGKAYTASGTTLTLSAALTNGTDEMYCVFLGRAVATNAPGAGSVGATQLASDAVTAAKLNDDIISGQTALGEAPADTDEFLVSDAGTLKRVDYSYIKGLSNWSESSGNLLPSNASYGIYLGVNSATAANLLDDYEEGTWTPTFTHGGSAVSSVTVNKANYTKVGRLVYVSMNARYTGSDLTGGDLIGAGLPFTSAAGNVLGVTGGYIHDPGSGNTNYDSGIAGSHDSNTNFFLVVTPGGRYQQRWLQNYYLSFACWYFV
jgi:hypothetical protein